MLKLELVQTDKHLTNDLLKIAYQNRLVLERADISTWMWRLGVNRARPK